MKVKRSKLEIFTSVFSFIVPIVIIWTILSGTYAFLKSQTDNTFAENYPFLCWVLNSWIKLEKDEKWCKTATILKDEYENKTKKLQEELVKELSTYIPLKVSSNVVTASPENTYIKNTYNSKINFNTIMEQFERIKALSQSKEIDNIECGNLKISDWNILTIRCTVFWWTIGSIDEEWKLGSSRIETLRFIKNLANTPHSSFAIETPPTNLNIEDVSTEKTLPPIFKTRTSLTISLKYIPFNPQF